MKNLDNEKLYHSFMAGAKEVIKQKRVLNEINVFPVADGDTGTNLASLMQSILNDSTLGGDQKSSLKSIADAALIGARGNSGIIFAQYLNGFIISLENDENEITVEQFVASAEKAVPYAYDAIENPVEGTMITLMKEFGVAVKKFKNSAKDFVELLGRGVDHLKVSLSETTESLAVLKKNNVVDAGAKGFFHFFDGFMKFVKNEEMDELYDETFDEESQIPEGEDFSNEQYRYCTEALITGENLEAKDIKVAMHELGDSLVVAGHKEKVRIHIHTDVPQDVFFKLRDFGQIVQQKVDDMKKQHEVAHARKYNIALVTDSIADLPQAYIDEHQIQQIPLNLMIEDANYYDKLTITSERFYQFMDELETYPTSSQPNQKQMENFFSYLSTYYDKIMVISVSSAMSGTYNVLKQAIKSLDDKTDVRLIDSRQNSGAEGLLVMRAQEMIIANKSLDEIEKALLTLREKTKILVSVKTLKYMVRSGRVSKVTGIIGKVANLKPVVSIDKDGEGIIFAKGLSLKSSNKKIRKHIEKVMAGGGIERYAIVHANAENRAEQYAEIYTGIIGQKPAYTMDISTIVAMSAGIGTVAIAYIRK